MNTYMNDHEGSEMDIESWLVSLGIDELEDDD